MPIEKDLTQIEKSPLILAIQQATRFAIDPEREDRLKHINALTKIYQGLTRGYTAKKGVFLDYTENGEKKKIKIFSEIPEYLRERNNLGFRIN